MHPQRRWIVIRCAALVVCLAATLALAWSELIKDPRPFISGKPESDERVQQAQELVQTVHGLAAVHAALAAPNLDALFTVRPRHAATMERPAPQPTAMLSVDMIIAAGNQGRAIISGRLARINDILSDGSRVADIRADGVLLEYKGRTRRLPAPRGRVTAME